MSKPEHPGQPNIIAEINVFLKTDWTDEEYHEVSMYLRSKGALAVACDTILPTEERFWQIVKRAIKAVTAGVGTSFESMKN